MNNLTKIQDSEIIEVSEIENYKDPFPKYLTKDEVYRIIDCIPQEKIKDKFLITFLWLSGLRISEALNIRKGDINLQEKVIKVIWLKRRKKQMRILPINNKLSEILLFFTATLKADEKIFNYSRQRAFAIIKKWVKISGINKKISPHTFRHSYAMNYYNQTKDIIGLQTLLGHAYINNTVIYSRMSGIDLKNKLNSIEN